MAVREFKPATCAADVFDWITPDEVVRLALGAFYGECARQRAAPDPEAGPDGWYSREAFAEFLAERLSVRLLAHAHDVGVRFDPRSAALERHYSEFPDWVTPFEFNPATPA
ncbi:hypothetical protein [Paracidovorax cattleyae]|uniref:hypothetical protein n=1 Tax=Paracidovorax cattleyae TaxID=80868 RepID=UPI0018AF79E2|nr:hypothetical protein [Paracidovorax cattleyae]MBF9264282.1 hypothetical protein [Paracidovorax cattleyae]